MDLEIAVPHTPGRLIPGGRTTVPVELHNVSDEALRLRLSLARGRVAEWAVVEPGTADLPPGAHRTVEVVFQPPADATLDTSLVPYTVRAVDALNASRSSSATGLVEIAGPGPGDDRETAATVPPAPARKRGRLLGALALAVVVAAAAFLAVRLGPASLPFSGRDDPAPGASGGSAAAVRRPYVMVDVYPQLEPSDRAAAEASVARLTAAGLPVRLIDSKASADIADGTDGFWVVLGDGFASADEANGFCVRYRTVTPRCEVVP
jgi:hypothetical protein